MEVPTKRKATNSSIDTEVENSKKSKLFPIFEKTQPPKCEKPIKSLQMEMEKAASPRTASRRKPMFGKQESSGLTQLNLDAGQKEIGPRFCKECGMLYSPGEAVDEEEHRNAHLRLQNMTSLKIWKDARILQSYIDGGQIIMVQCATDKKLVMNRLKNFLAWIDSELGAGSDVNPNMATRRVFLYVYPSSRKDIVRVFGCAVTEIINPDRVVAFQIPLPGSLKADADKEEKSNNQEIYTKIWVGITRLWTDKDFRKRKIASRLCDMILTHSGILGCVVPKDKLGILEPSSDGRAFMYRYTNGTGALYSCKSGTDSQSSF